MEMCKKCVGKGNNRLSTILGENTKLRNIYKEVQ